MGLTLPLDGAHACVYIRITLVMVHAPPCGKINSINILQMADTRTDHAHRHQILQYICNCFNSSLATRDSSPASSFCPVHPYFPGDQCVTLVPAYCIHRNVRKFLHLSVVGATSYIRCCVVVSLINRSRFIVGR